MQRIIMFLWYIPIKEQYVDILTKELLRGKFEFQKCRIVVIENPFLAKREF